MGGILDLLASRNYIAVNRPLAHELGLDAAVIFGELASEYSYWRENGGLEPDGAFFTTVENIERNTTLSKHKQGNALNRLLGLGLISISYRGIPRKRYIKLNESVIMDMFASKWAKNSPTGSKEIEPMDGEKFDGNNNKGNNNKEKKKKESYNEIVNAFTENGELRETIFEFIKMRKMIKAPMTDRALRLLLNKLQGISNNEQIQIDTLNRAIVNNWKSVYPLKDGGYQKPAKKAYEPTDKTEWPEF